MGTVEDPMSHARAHRALAESPDVDPLAVDVGSHDGKLRLSGEVGSYAEKLAALQAVGAEVEISGVDNDLTVRPYGTFSSLADQTIADAIQLALRDLNLPVDAIRIQVDQHVVSLTGLVPTFAIRSQIRHAIENVPGVNLIENHIRVEASGDPVRVLDEQECWRLLRTAPYGRIAVAVAGDVDIFPINFVVADDQAIYFRTAPGSKLLALTINNRVAIEVDIFDGAEAWSVVLKGVAEQIERQSEIVAADALPLRPLVPTLKYRWVRVRPSSVSGREFQTAPEPER